MSTQDLPAPTSTPPASTRLEPGQLLFEAPRRGKPPRHLADLTLAERKDAVTKSGLPGFRAAQLSKHYFGRLVDDPAEWTDVPAAQRETLYAGLFPRLMTSVREITCDSGTTRKTLWRMHDGALVESVLMRYPDRVTMCVSSQAGCGMNCPFCATGQAGLTRNLSTAEIVEQVVAGARLLADGRLPAGGVRGGGTPPREQGGSAADRSPRGDRISNVVFMGMGEPLANYASVVAAVRRLTDPLPEGMGISRRSVTVSTV